MKALWVILIDTSGSMGQPFSGKNDFQGLIESGSYHTKLDAAKAIVLKQLNGVSTGHVALVGFADQPYLIFKGPVYDAKEFRHPIEVLNADGGTNIAAALLFALLKLGDLKIYRVINFLIISDGISNQGDPVAAAEKCASSQLGIRISTILIDPTPEGEEIARAISIGGDVKGVTSDSRLDEAVGEAKVVHKQAIAYQTTLVTLIALVTAVTGLSVTISGIYTGIAERPNITIPILLASISTISATILTYLAFAKEKIERGFYITADAEEMHFPKIYKYSKRLRVFALVTALICVTVAVSLIFFASSAARNTNKEIAAEQAVVNGVTFEMVAIPGGSFLMGSSDGESNRFDNEGPQHKVTISPVYLGKYEVTQAQWRSVAKLPKVNIELESEPSYFKGNNLPVENVMWLEAVEFCQRLSRATGHKYRLPTEAEWEYACRAGTVGPYAGNLDEIAWYSKNSGLTTHPVGQKKPNAWGLYDMHGNVREWCQDRYGAYSNNDEVDPQGPISGQLRVVRSGDAYNDDSRCRSATRSGDAADLRLMVHGFRVVRTSN